MDVLKVNPFGRSYHSGKSLSSDLRTQVIDTIIAEGGDRATGFIPVTYAQLSKELRLSLNAVKNIWRRYCEQWRSQPDNLVPLCKFHSITIIYFFRN